MYALDDSQDLITVCTVIYGGESHSLIFSLFRESPPAVTSVVFREKEKGLERGVERDRLRS